MSTIKKIACGSLVAVLAPAEVIADSKKPILERARAVNEAYTSFLEENTKEGQMQGAQAKMTALMSEFQQILAEQAANQAATEKKIQNVMAEMGAAAEKPFGYNSWSDLNPWGAKHNDPSGADDAEDADGS